MPELNIIGAKEDNRYFPYQGALRVTRKSFWTAGQDSFTNPPAQNPDMFQALTNVEPITQGNLKRRRGYQLLSQQSPTIPYREGYSFRSESLNLKSQVWTSTSNVLALNEDGSANTSTLFAPSLNAAFAPRMVLSRNYGYFADGAISDNLKWDGTQNAGNVTNWGIGVQGVVTGPNAPGTATDLGNSGGNASAGPFGATSFSSVAPGTAAWTTSSTGGSAGPLSGQTTQTLNSTGCGFNVPVGATITGIAVTFYVIAGSNVSSMQDNQIFLVKAGVSVGTNHANGTIFSSLATTAYTYGGSTDLWGTTWTPAQINASNFGAAFQALNNGPQQGLIVVTNTPNSGVVITVYYTLPATGSWANPNNIKVQDGLVATTTASTSQSSELQATNFGFAISAGSTVLGIQVDIKLSTSGNIPTINPILTKNSVGYGTRKVASFSNASLGFITFGGPTDLWGGVWTSTDINATTSGCQFYVLSTSGNPTISVDFVRITVYTTIAPVTIAISGTGITLLSGTVYTIAFQNSVTGHPSDIIPFSANTGPLTNQGISITNIPVSTDPQVDTKLILRPADGADTTTLYLITTIPNATTSYFDTMPDSTLLTQPIFQQTNSDGSLHGIVNNKRPLGINFPTKHKGRIYGSIQSTLYFSKNLDEVTTSTGTITSKWEEAWPATNQLDVSETAETIQGLLSDGETLWIGTERCIRRLIGDSPTNFQKPEIQFNEAGLLNQDSWKVIFQNNQPIGTMWLTPDFKIMWSDFNTYDDAGAPIQDVLNTINPAAVSTIHASYVSKGQASYYMLHIPTGTNIVPNKVCVFNIKTKKWCIWNPTDLLTASLFFIDGTGAPRWTFATNAGPLYEWKESLFQDRVNNTPVRYSVPITTSWLDFGDEGLTKAFNKIFLTTQDTNLTVAVQGAIRDSDLDSGGVLVLPTTPIQPEIFGDLFVPMVAQPGFYKWYQLTFTSPASQVVDVLDGFDFEIIPSMRM